MSVRLDTAPSSRTWSAGDWAFFVALIATALALGAALAHALELPSKMALSKEAYFTVQQIYAGWNRLALLLLIELAGMLAVLVLYIGRPQVVLLTTGAIVSLLLAQAVFWTWTFPANAATENWTVQPDGWEALRRQWEYSHLAGAGFQLLSMTLLIAAVLVRDRPRRPIETPPAM